MQRLLLYYIFQLIIFILQILAHFEELLAFKLPQIAIIGCFISLDNLDLHSHTIKLIHCLKFHLSFSLKLLFHVDNSFIISHLCQFHFFIETSILIREFFHFFVPRFELIHNFLKINIFQDFNISNFSLHCFNLLRFGTFEL